MKLLFPLLVFSLMTAGAHVARAQSALDEASAAIQTQHYDTAITDLESYLAGNPNNAYAHILLAQAYHWKKDIPKAKRQYQAAAALDSRYRLEIIPLLDEEKDWSGIVALAAPELNTDKPVAPSLLGALASAYRALNRADDSARVRNILAGTVYRDQDDRDYQDYVLAYCYLWDGDTGRAMGRLRMITAKAYLTYAATDEKFQTLFTDKEFIDLTK